MRVSVKFENFLAIPLFLLDTKSVRLIRRSHLHDQMPGLTSFFALEIFNIFAFVELSFEIILSLSGEKKMKSKIYQLVVYSSLAFAAANARAQTPTQAPNISLGTGTFIQAGINNGKSYGSIGIGTSAMTQSGINSGEAIDNIGLGNQVFIQAGINSGKASRNIAVGNSVLLQAGLNTGSASDNIAVGNRAMIQSGINDGQANSNIAIGNNSLSQAGMGKGNSANNNIVLGHDSSVAWFSKGVNNSVTIGNKIRVAKSNEVIIGDGSGHIKMLMNQSGSVGVGVLDPKAKLDVAGTMKIAKYSNQPYACTSEFDAVTALTSKYTTCVCNGGVKKWVRTSDGTTACVW